MGARQNRKEAKAKRESGGFAPLPYQLLRSHSLGALSPRATKLLLDLLAQYNGFNNGDLAVAWKLMKKRGWHSQMTLNKAKDELLDRDMIMVTRQGGRNKATLYALTFYAIDHCKGKLDVSSTHSPLSTWKRHEPLSEALKKMRERTKKLPYSTNESNDPATTPSSGAADASITPDSVPNSPVSGA